MPEVDQKSFTKEEQKILELWKKLDVFHTCLKQSKDRPRYLFAYISVIMYLFIHLIYSYLFCFIFYYYFYFYSFFICLVRLGAWAKVKLGAYVELCVTEAFISSTLVVEPVESQNPLFWDTGPV